MKNKEVLEQLKWCTNNPSVYSTEILFHKGLLQAVISILEGVIDEDN